MFNKTNYDELVKSPNSLISSFPRKRESSVFNLLWTPAFAGVTAFLTFYETINMGNEPNDHATIRIPPPLFFFACLGIGLLLEYLSPIHLVSISLIPRVLVGGAFILISIYFAFSGFVVLINNKTPFDTAKSTLKIVQEGPYRFSRNPLYLSLLLLLFVAD